MLRVEGFHKAYLQLKRSITPGSRLVAFWVKPLEGVAREVNVMRHQRRDVSAGSLVTGWAMMADPPLIVKSSRALMRLTDRHQWPTSDDLGPAAGVNVEGRAKSRRSSHRSWTIGWSSGPGRGSQARCAASR
jgi:hypothetical protein